MSPTNPYLVYKRDTSRLIYWIVKTSNAIISSASALPDDAPKVCNTTGQVTVSGLTSLCKLIAKYIDRTPSAILELFDAVIKGRTALHLTFKQFSAGQDDPDIHKSNESHRHFIDVLTEAFGVLGGVQWAQEKLSTSSTGPTHSSSTGDQEDIEQVLFSNTFSALTIDTQGEQDEEEDAASDADLDHQPQNRPGPRRQQKKSSGKGTKRKNGKSNKKKQKQKKQAQEPTQVPDDIPIESYRIIQDKDGIVTEYLMAVYNLVKEWVDIRAYLQDLWQDVAYRGLNSAVAAAVSNIGIQMIERSAAAMFADFPGHESYETVIDTITRGDPDKAQGQFSFALHRYNGASTHKVREAAIDVKEQFLIHTYRDLVDFLTDFQKTRSGKPTKALLKELGAWNPKLDLRKATETERLKWRRAYTINWLYDLVNVFSSIVVQRNTLRGEHHRLELVNWSPDGPWDQHRRVWGLTKFAGVITHLAMQKPGSDIRRKIDPHHVFQLQCIVDSFTISRGWSLNAWEGHVLRAPARDFRPGRDIELFLDRENKEIGRGFLQAVDLLKQVLQKDGLVHGDLHRHESGFLILESLQYDFINWLGESKYMNGLDTIPPSRFSSTNSNGLYDYSPFLCGAGLAEGLVDAYRYSLVVLDKLPEPVLLVHLHNMLVQKGYIKKPVGLYSSFQELFPSSFFVDGEAPTSDFIQALRARTMRIRQGHRKPPRLEDVKQLSAATFFTKKSYLMACSQADWNIEKIPDSDIPMPSLLGSYRLMHTKHTVDPKTRELKMEDTDLVRRARKKGMSDQYLVEAKSKLAVASEPQPVPDAVRESMVPEGYTMGPSITPTSMAGYVDITQRGLLDLAKNDLYQDICGKVPYSSMNYVFVTMRFMMQFMQFETELRKLRNPLYVQAYETDPQWRRNERVGLAYLALEQQEDECLRVMAREFQNPRSGFMDFIYWPDLDTSDDFDGMSGPRDQHDRPMPDQCNVM
ncbi:hypothetical protein GGS20DRAFT_535631 [Poronia punctata]|nr:hypothetical protein GGS20DRAFT_535631 [Poronia punctata]